MIGPFRSMREFLAEAKVLRPDQVILTFVNDRGAESARFTRRLLDERARTIAHALRHEHGLRPGDTVLLVYPPGLGFVEALVACFFAGILPVPVPPPLPLRPELGLPGYSHIAANARAKAQLTSAAYSRGRTFGKIREALRGKSRWPELPWIVTDRISGEMLTERDVYEPTDNEVALIQYTSGSTRLPKGVEITHRNLWEQCYLIQSHLFTGTGSVVLWMPHYHDFTLMGGVINCLYGDVSLVLFSALGFLKRPALWGELMHRYRANTTASPDFGYEFLTSRTTAEDRARWDLRSLRVAICAAEPIRPKTVNRFLDAFAPSGIRPETFCPCYGLAEHTIGVTLHGRKRIHLDRRALETPGSKLIPVLKSTETVEFIGCGPPAEGVEVRIVDPESFSALGEGLSGEIWVHSKNVARGYLDQPEETRARFHGRITGSDRNWLRTGDLGAFCDGELIVLGRLDDVVNLRGKNYTPQDIELTATEADSRIRPGRVIAFTDEGVAGRELFVLLELRNEARDVPEIDAISSAIRILLLQELGLSAATLVYLRQGAIPKTTSGKLQRKKARAEWANGRLPHHRVHRGAGSEN